MMFILHDICPTVLKLIMILTYTFTQRAVCDDCFNLHDICPPVSQLIMIFILVYIQVIISCDSWCHTKCAAIQETPDKYLHHVRRLKDK